MHQIDVTLRFHNAQQIKHRSKKVNHAVRLPCNKVGATLLNL